MHVYIFTVNVGSGEPKAKATVKSEGLEDCTRERDAIKPTCPNDVYSENSIGSTAPVAATKAARMALYRSKLGPVGGGNDSGTSEGGVVVDLDPLSAFALMDDGTTEDLGGTTSNVVSSSRRVGTKPSPHSATVAPPRKDHNPSLGGKSLAGETKKNDSGRWRVSDLSSVSPSQQVHRSLADRYCYKYILA